MPKSRNQKLKIIYLYDILKRQTDQDHGITMRQILSQLEAYGVTAERKSIYEDIALLRDVYGADIGDDGYSGRHDHGSYDYWRSRCACSAWHAMQHENASAR